MSAASIKSFVAGIALIAIGVLVSQLSASLPELPQFQSELSLALAFLALGGAMGWFFPHGGGGLIAAAGTAALGGAIVAGGYFPFFLLIFTMYGLPRLVAFFVGWLLGRTVVIYAGLGDSRINERVGFVLIGAVVIAPFAWLVWDDRHSVRSGAFESTLLETNPRAWLLPPQTWTLRIGEAAQGTPVAGRGRVYVTAGGVLSGVDSSGVVAWTLPKATTQPLLDGDRLYAGLESGVARIDSETGLTMWIADVPIKALNVSSRENQRRLSIGASHRIYANPEYNLVSAISPEGSVAWAFRRTAGTFLGAPVEGPSGNVYVAGLGPGRADVCAIDGNGKLLWQRTLPTPSSGPLTVGNDESIYVPGESVLFALTKDGVERWRREFKNGIDSVLIYSAGAVSRKGERPASVLVNSRGWYALDRDGGAIYRLLSEGQLVFAGEETLLATEDALEGYRGGQMLYMQKAWPTNSRPVLASGPDGMIYAQLPRELIGFPQPTPPYHLHQQGWW